MSESRLDSTKSQDFYFYSILLFRTHIQKQRPWLKN